MTKIIFSCFSSISPLRHLCCRGKEDRDKVVLYFDSWPREEQCIALPLKQVDNNDMIKQVDNNDMFEPRTNLKSISSKDNHIA